MRNRPTYKMFIKMFSDRNDEGQKGASYVRWGRKTCEANATLVYKGTL